MMNAETQKYFRDYIRNFYKWFGELGELRGDVSSNKVTLSYAKSEWGKRFKVIENDITWMFNVLREQETDEERRKKWSLMIQDISDFIKFNRNIKADDAKQSKGLQDLRTGLKAYELSLAQIKK